jgi:SPFH domain / Band 7 family
VFNEVTRNFQAVTIQGQLTYRIHEPKRAAELLNFTMNPVGHQYISNDPDRLALRISNVIQMETRAEIQRRSLEEVLSQFETIAASVQSRIKDSLLLDPLGAELFVTMAQATLHDGQTLLAVNDLFIGQKTHTSARYRIRYDDHEEDQSSSGIIVSTGAGSTGWYRSIVTGAVGLVEGLADNSKVGGLRDQYRFDWEARISSSASASRLPARPRAPRLSLAPLTMAHRWKSSLTCRRTA